ncbi:MAG: hypothetical protein HQL18_05075, partial [Candidatus Omnitrophica bacterium]|nr:hypothetical protein [Candidatus Omnitrophota bacterium]
TISVAPVGVFSTSEKMELWGFLGAMALVIIVGIIAIVKLVRRGPVTSFDCWMNKYWRVVSFFFFLTMAEVFFFSVPTFFNVCLALVLSAAGFAIFVFNRSGIQYGLRTLLGFVLWLGLLQMYYLADISLFPISGRIDNVFRQEQLKRLFGAKQDLSRCDALIREGVEAVLREPPFGIDPKEIEKIDVENYILQTAVVRLKDGSEYDVDLRYPNLTCETRESLLRKKMEQFTKEDRQRAEQEMQKSEQEIARKKEGYRKKLDDDFNKGMDQRRKDYKELEQETQDLRERLKKSFLPKSQDQPKSEERKPTVAPKGNGFAHFGVLLALAVAAMATLAVAALPHAGLVLVLIAACFVVGLAWTEGNPVVLVGKPQSGREVDEADPDRKAVKVNRHGVAGTDRNELFWASFVINPDVDRNCGRQNSVKGPGIHISPDNDRRGRAGNRQAKKSPDKTMSIAVAQDVARTFAKEGKIAAAEMYAGMCAPMGLAFRQWRIETYGPQPPPMDVVRTWISRVNARGEIEYHPAFKYLERNSPDIALLIRRHEELHQLNPGLDDMQLCRIQVFEMSRRDFLGTGGLAGAAPMFEPMLAPLKAWKTIVEALYDPALYLQSKAAQDRLLQYLVEYGCVKSGVDNRKLVDSTPVHLLPRRLADEYGIHVSYYGAPDARLDWDGCVLSLVKKDLLDRLPLDAQGAILKASCTPGELNPNERGVEFRHLGLPRRLGAVLEQGGLRLDENFRLKQADELLRKLQSPESEVRENLNRKVEAAARQEALEQEERERRERERRAQWEEDGRRRVEEYRKAQEAEHVKTLAAREYAYALEALLTGRIRDLETDYVVCELDVAQYEVAYDHLAARVVEIEQRELLLNCVVLALPPELRQDFINRLNPEEDVAGRSIYLQTAQRILAADKFRQAADGVFVTRNPDGTLHASRERAEGSVPILSFDSAPDDLVGAKNQPQEQHAAPVKRSDDVTGTPAQEIRKAWADLKARIAPQLTTLLGLMEKGARQSWTRKEARTYNALMKAFRGFWLKYHDEMAQSRPNKDFWNFVAGMFDWAVCQHIGYAGLYAQRMCDGDPWQDEWRNEIAEYLRSFKVTDRYLSSLTEVRISSPGFDRASMFIPGAMNQRPRRDFKYLVVGLDKVVEDKTWGARQKRAVQPRASRVIASGRARINTSAPCTAPGERSDDVTGTSAAKIRKAWADLKARIAPRQEHNGAYKGTRAQMIKGIRGNGLTHLGVLIAVAVAGLAAFIFGPAVVHGIAQIIQTSGEFSTHAAQAPPGSLISTLLVPALACLPFMMCAVKDSFAVPARHSEDLEKDKSRLRSQADAFLRRTGATYTQDKMIEEASTSAGSPAARMTVFSSWPCMLQWFKNADNVKDISRVVMLPYMEGLAHRYRLGAFLEMMDKNCQPGKIHRSRFYPAAVNVVDRRGRKIAYVLMSELEAEHPQPLDGVTVVHHRTSAEEAAAVIRHGFYTIPGRINFNGCDSCRNDLINVVFAIPSRDLLYSQRAGGMFCAGATMAEKKMGRRLPAAVRRKFMEIAQRLDMRSSRGFDASYFSRMKADTLLLGERSGFLTHFPPETVNVEETVRLNRERVSTGKLDRNVLAKFLAALVRRPASGPAAAADPRSAGLAHAGLLVVAPFKVVGGKLVFSAAGLWWGLAVLVIVLAVSTLKGILGWLARKCRFWDTSAAAAIGVVKFASPLFAGAFACAGLLSVWPDKAASLSSIKQPVGIVLPEEAKQIPGRDSSPLRQDKSLRNSPGRTILIPWNILRSSRWLSRLTMQLARAAKAASRNLSSLRSTEAPLNKRAGVTRIACLWIFSINELASSLWIFLRNFVRPSTSFNSSSVAAETTGTKTFSFMALMTRRGVPVLEHKPETKTLVSMMALSMLFFTAIVDFFKNFAGRCSGSFARINARQNSAHFQTGGHILKPVGQPDLFFIRHLVDRVDNLFSAKIKRYFGHFISPLLNRKITRFLGRSQLWSRTPSPAVAVRQEHNGAYKGTRAQMIKG